MRAIVTVIGPDRIGIIAEVCSLLAGMRINIVDISQTIMQNIFTMVMLVDAAECPTGFDGIASALTKKGEEMNLSIRIQREDTFNAMHQV